MIVVDPNEMEKKSYSKDIRSIKFFHKDDDDNDDELIDRAYLPDISTVKRQEDKFYQHLLPIDNGIYDGTVNEKFLREGLGTYSINNGEEYYSGIWKNDKPHGCGYMFKNDGSTIYHGEFYNEILKEGYGKVRLENSYEYKGTIKDGNFHGLGSLSIRIEGLKEIDSSNIEKDTLKIIAEWENGRTIKIYVDEIKQYYEYQYKIFCNSLESISSNTENRQKQKEYFQILTDLLSKNLLSRNLLYEIVIHSNLPRELKSSADLLYKLENSYLDLKQYIDIDIKKSYNDCIKNICEIGLKIYARRLAWNEDNYEINCIYSKEIFYDNLNKFSEVSNFDNLKKVLLINTFVVDSIQKMIHFANERLLRISSQYHLDFISSHTEFIKRIWMDYFQSIKSDLTPEKLDDISDAKYHFYTDCYSNLLELSFVNLTEIDTELKIDRKNSLENDDKIKNDIELIIYKSMRFALEYLKPWRNFEINELSSYFNETIHSNISIKELEDKLLIKILLNITKKLDDFFIKNRKKFSNILELIEDYGKNRLLTDIHFNYQSKMKEIIRISNYLLQISESQTSPIIDIIDLQLQSIKICIEKKDSVTKFIDHFLNLNIEFSKLSRCFETLFSPNIDYKFNEIARRIISLLKDIFKMILENENITSMKSEILNKYETSDLEVALRGAVYKRNIYHLEILLELGANINAQGPKSKKTALHWAFEENDKEMILHLLGKGADMDIKDVTGKSPFDHAKNNQIDLDAIKSEEIENSNEFENRLYALQKFDNFLRNLQSVDFTWYVESKNIRKLDNNLFEKVPEKDLYRVANIENAKINVKKDFCSHYVLEIIEELLKYIKNLKIFNRSTPIERNKIRAELIMAIGKSFKYLNDQLRYITLEKFKNDCIIPFKDVIDGSESYKEFCNKLEKIDLYFLYGRKLKEITIDHALDLFQKRNENFSTRNIKEAFLKYEKFFNQYFHNIIDKTNTIKDIVEETKHSTEKSNFKRKDIPVIIAGLSVILSLGVSDFIEKNQQDEYVLKEKYNKKYFLQPHCIQILGILLLLDIDGETNSIPSNHLAEILTGQGKSWTLALLAGFFCLNNYQVTVACYSDYLSKRDEKDFKYYLAPFKFTNSVEYRTFDLMCEEKLTSKTHNKELRGIIFDIMSGKHLTPESSCNDQNDKYILLIDEVDVFFSHSFGVLYCPGLRIKNKCLVEIQKDIWEKLMTHKINKEQLKILAKKKNT